MLLTSNGSLVSESTSESSVLLPGLNSCPRLLHSRWIYNILFVCKLLPNTRYDECGYKTRGHKKVVVIVPAEIFLMHEMKFKKL